MPLNRISTADPSLQKIMDATDREINKLENLPFYIGNPTEIQTERYNAALEDLVICDPTKEGFTVALPDISREDVGKLITVVNSTSSTNTITIKPGGNQTINGSTSDTITTAYGTKIYVAVSTTEWVR